MLHATAKLLPRKVLTFRLVVENMAVQLHCQAAGAALEVARYEGMQSKDSNKLSLPSVYLYNLVFFHRVQANMTQHTADANLPEGNVQLKNNNFLKDDGGVW